MMDFFHKQLYASLLETENRTRLRSNISWAQNDANFITTNIGFKLFLLLTKEICAKAGSKEPKKKKVPMTLHLNFSLETSLYNLLRPCTSINNSKII